MNWPEIFVSLGFGLALTELTDMSPWLARRLVRWAARTWSTEPEVAAGYAEEWTAIITERPGKLLKLLTALGFVCGAIGRAGPRDIRTAVQLIKEYPALRSVIRALEIVDRGESWSITVIVAMTTGIIVSMLYAFGAHFGLASLLFGIAAFVLCVLSNALQRARRGQSSSGR
jgi:hypothetical protein